jgi:two-component system chemotaxis response regulator CheB
VLTGMLDDGTSGLQAIKRCGGIAVVQDPRDALEPSMPQSALRYVDVDHCVPIAAMGDLLADLAVAPRPVGAQLDDERASHEHDLTLSSGDAMEHLSAIGTPSPYVCPECHGGLWEINDVRPRRFRCHTGHAFTLRSLQHALASTSDEALWNAFRALEERAFVVQELIKSSSDLDPPDERATLQSIAEELNRRALELRALLERVPDPIE